MNRYIIHISRTELYEISVVASDQDDALDMAYECLRSAKPISYENETGRIDIVKLSNDSEDEGDDK